MALIVGTMSENDLAQARDIAGYDVVEDVMLRCAAGRIPLGELSDEVPVAVFLDCEVKDLLIGGVGHQQMSQYEYVEEHEGRRCPFCGSKEMEGDDHIPSGNTLTQRVQCETCGRIWVDIYKLERYQA